MMAAPPFLGSGLALSLHFPALSIRYLAVERQCCNIEIVSQQRLCALTFPSCGQFEELCRQM